jgi:hypothetical protein
MPPSLSHDRDPLFTLAFRETLAAAGVQVVRLPRRSTNLNAYAERVVRAIKESCLDRLVLVGEECRFSIAAAWLRIQARSLRVVRLYVLPDAGHCGGGPLPECSRSVLCSAPASEVVEVRMTLTAPRFTSIPQLIRASQNSVPLIQGATGQGVQALQLALVELGFGMPRSTKEGTRLPDGIFGPETRSVVMEFQRVNGLKPDGVVGRMTLQALDLRIVAESERRALEALRESRQRSPFI